MRDAYSPREARDESVPLQAFLYANGELDSAEASAFERRLGEDQSAREALCQAVQLSRTLNRLAAARPNPAYRERVRERLRRRSCWNWLFGQRTYRGHPAIWSAVGAAAAVLLVIGLAQLPAALITQPHPPLPEPRKAIHKEEVVPAPVVEVPQLATSEDVASRWADLHDTSRVTRAHEEEMRRKHRSDDRFKPTKPGEHRSRPMSNQSPRER
jgi:hypothetical protein